MEFLHWVDHHWLFVIVVTILVVAVFKFRQLWKKIHQLDAEPELPPTRSQLKNEQQLLEELNIKEKDGKYVP